jgi:hypothetical protein
MMKMVRIAIAFLLVSASPVWAGEIKGTCLLRFVGISTLHDFSGTVRCRPFSAGLVKSARPFSAGLVKSADGGAGIPAVEVDVLVDEMDTGNETRDGQMREMFQSDGFPRIHGTVREINVDGIRREIGEEGGGKAFFDLTLRVRDVERTIQAAVTNCGIPRIA